MPNNVCWQMKDFVLNKVWLNTAQSYEKLRCRLLVLSACSNAIYIGIVRGATLYLCITSGNCHECSVGHTQCQNAVKYKDF